MFDNGLSTSGFFLDNVQLCTIDFYHASQRPGVASLSLDDLRTYRVLHNNLEVEVLIGGLHVLHIYGDTAGRHEIQEVRPSGKSRGLMSARLFSPVSPAKFGRL